MPSVRAEVLLHFGVESKEFEKSVSILEGLRLPSAAIIEILSPVYDEGYFDGWEARGYGDER